MPFQPGQGDPASPAPPVLHGRWRLVRADPALDFAPGVSMEFRTGGRLLYSFDVGHRREVMHLVYRVEGDVLHTEDPRTSHEVVTHYTFGPAEVLIFDFGGPKAWFVKELPR